MSVGWFLKMEYNVDTVGYTVRICMINESV